MKLRIFFEDNNKYWVKVRINEAVKFYTHSPKLRPMGELGPVTVQIILDMAWFSR